MTRRFWYALIAAPFITSAPSHAQEAAPATPAAQHAPETSAFDRTLSAHLDGVTLREALVVISSQSGVRLLYNATHLPLNNRVSLEADRITVREALGIVLAGTGFQATASATGGIRLDPVDADTGTFIHDPRQQGTATITGYVRDSATGASIPQVMIRVDGTSLETKTGVDGQFKILGVAAGESRVTARRVGYIARMRTITLAEGQSAALNFFLNPPATKLDEVVTTALGDQRRYQVGNVISTINVDSLVPTTPVTSVTDIISARAPGVEVVETGGLAGSGESIRIRGQSSLLLQGDPIIIVDGIREDNTAGTSYNPLLGAVATPSRLNDLDFTQIQTIDVLKGPAAATEYGTDAANGVIVITTKRGTVGRPQWRVSGENDATDIPVSFPQYYYSWGHMTNGTQSAIQCGLIPLYGGTDAQYGPPYDIGSTYGTCMTDSVTHFNPLDDPAYSIYGTGTREKYDLSVGGGSEAFRYYLSGGLSNETGVARVPPVLRTQALALGFPESALNPNGEDQRSIAFNSMIRLSATADVTVTTAYMSTFQDTPSAGLSLSTRGPVLADSSHNYGYNSNALGQLGEIQTQQTDRLTGGLAANWRPSEWLAVHGTVGLDHGLTTAIGEWLPQAYQARYSQADQGRSSYSNVGTDIYSADLRASATLPLGRAVRAVTSLGVQMADDRSQGLTAFAFGISPTNLTLNGVSNPGLSQEGDRSATLGSYAEEEIGVSERLFITGALRVDAGSGFGRAYSSATYPKASVSWLAVNDGPTTVRLRGAWGESGVQPLNGSALPLYQESTAWLNGQSASTAQLYAPGNPALQPERSEEYEGGADLGLWSNRVSIELTGYSKTTQDALYNEQLGWDLSGYTFQTNIGEVRNTGAELAVVASIVRTHLLTWDLSVSGSVDHNELVHLAAGFPTSGDIAFGEPERFTPGYPLYGYWGEREQYTDVNHDGIIEGDEASLADTESYLGSSLPTREVSVSTHIGLWREAVAIGALFDYRGGFRVYNGAAYYGAYASVLPEDNDPSASLWLQGRAVSSGLPVSCCDTYASGLFEDGTYLRFRELSLTYALPAHWVRAVRLHDLSLTGAVRNLVLWTRFTGPDPEVSAAGGGTEVTQFNSNTEGINNDLRESNANAVPLARYWLIRLNIGL